MLLNTAPDGKEAGIGSYGQGRRTKLTKAMYQTIVRGPMCLRPYSGRAQRQTRCT